MLIVITQGNFFLDLSILGYMGNYQMKWNGLDGHAFGGNRPNVVSGC